MSANEEFFRERRAQAVFKHGILSRYPTVFAAKTGRRGRQVMFVDGYAGRGRYEDGSDGSPALLVQSAERVQSFRDVGGIYVERDRRQYENLKEVVAGYGRPNHVALYGDVRDRLPEILDRARNTALFVFLDPFGAALERAQLVGSLLGRARDLGPTEVLLHFSVSTVARMGGILRRRHRDGIRLSEKDQKTIAHGDLFLGGEWWHEHFESVDENDEERATVAALRVADLYQAGIDQETGYKSASMPIRPTPGLLPKYVLVLFTQHVDGLWFFADAVGKAGREWLGAWRDKAVNAELDKIRARHPAGTGLFDIDEVLPDVAPFDANAYEKQYRDEWTRRIKANIVSLLDTGPLVLPEKIVDVYGPVLGLAGERHVRAAVKSLRDSNVVSANLQGGTWFRHPLSRL